MRRRNFLSSVIQSVLALPFMGFVSKTVSSTRVQVCAVQTDDFCLKDLSANTQDGLIQLTKMLNEKLDYLVSTCVRDGVPLTRLEICYRNIRHETVNPDGNLPFFRIVASRGTDIPEYNGILISNGEWVKVKGA